MPLLATLQQHLRAGGRLCLFLDYDGTLVPIARTPEKARPEATLLQLLFRLAQTRLIRIAILSGRPLSSLQALLPIPGIILAGIYGVEIQMPEDGTTVRAERTTIRPVIEQVISAWSALIAGRDGFLLEDKGLAIALHARFADPGDADYVLSRARGIATATISPDQFRILEGKWFLEVAPAAAHKGHAVEWLLDRDPFSSAFLVYFGDDDKDEEAFGTVRQRGGISVLVGPRRDNTQAQTQLPDPDAVRQWLEILWQAASAHYGTRDSRLGYLCD